MKTDLDPGEMKFRSLMRVLAYRGGEATKKRYRNDRLHFKAIGAMGGRASADARRERCRREAILEEERLTPKAKVRGLVGTHDTTDLGYDPEEWGLWEAPDRLAIPDAKPEAVTSPAPTVVIAPEVVKPAERSIYDIVAEMERGMPDPEERFRPYY